MNTHRRPRAGAGRRPAHRLWHGRPGAEAQGEAGRGADAAGAGGQRRRGDGGRTGEVAGGRLISSTPHPGPGPGPHTPNPPPRRPPTDRQARRRARRGRHLWRRQGRIPERPRGRRRGGRGRAAAGDAAEQGGQGGGAQGCVFFVEVPGRGVALLDVGPSAGSPRWSLILKPHQPTNQPTPSIHPGVNVVFDPVGGPLLFEALKTLAWGSQYLSIGFVAGIPKVPANLLLVKNCTVRPAAALRDAGCTLLFYSHGQTRRSAGASDPRPLTPPPTPQPSSTASSGAAT
jgi:hypothetical protein